MLHKPFGKFCECTNRTSEDMELIYKSYSKDRLDEHYVRWGCWVFQNGSENYTRICSKCKMPLKEISTDWVKKTKLQRFMNLDDVEVIDDKRTDVECSHKDCSDNSVEWHHWAPKEIFGPTEASKWPVDPLCKNHHDLWHDAMIEGFYDESDYVMVYGVPVRRHSRPSRR